MVRVLAVAGLTAVGFSCADQSISGVGAKLALLPISPAFTTAPDGGPDIDIRKIRGVLKNASGTDSALAEATVQGDSAILEFLRVTVNGDSTPYHLGVQALDQNDVLVFQGSQTIQVKPGENPPATPTMTYVAPDTAAKTLDIRIGTTSSASANLRWQGAISGNTTCLNRVPEASPTTQVQLNVIGKTQAGADVTGVRVGWTSLDTSVATVDDNGLVKSRCANKTTGVIARTFTDRADTIAINVFAPPFTLRMNPEVASIARGAQRQLDARVIDELGNESSATGITWTTSDATKATVSSTGLVTAVRNGRVQITASQGDRSTVAIVDVVRPAAASLKIVPQRDTATFGQFRQFIARAFDAAGQVISDAVEFTWSVSNTAVATIDAKGLAKTNVNSVVDTTIVSATLDGKTGTGSLRIVSSLPGGTIAGIVRDGQTDAVLSGVTIQIAGGASTTSDANGRFSLPNVHQGDDILLSKSGYVGIKFLEAPAFPNQTIQIREIPLPPTSASNGTVSGKVVNALNGQGVSSVTVKAYKDLNSAPSARRPSPAVVATTTTASNGTYSFSLAPGAYTFIASGTGYSEGPGIGVAVGGIPMITTDVILPPIAPSAGLYAVLTWGHGGAGVPTDLDLHITGPISATDTNRFQVHSGSRSHLVGIDTIATIDVVGNTGPGPEVGSVRASAPPGVYRFYVKNVSDIANATSTALANSSDARVEVFQDNRIVATFLPPAGSAGTVWEVFRFDGARIIPSGAMSTPGTPNVLPSMVVPETPLRSDTRTRTRQ